MEEFEFDDDKSKANLAKHGIDFEAAQVLWRDPDLLEIQAKTEGEPRFSHHWPDRCKALVCCRYL